MVSAFPAEVYFLGGTLGLQLGDNAFGSGWVFQGQQDPAAKGPGITRFNLHNPVN